MTNTAPNFPLSLNVFSATWRECFQIPRVNISFSPGLICKYIYWLCEGEAVFPYCLFLGLLLWWLSVGCLVGVCPRPESVPGWSLSPAGVCPRLESVPGRSLSPAGVCPRPESVPGRSLSPAGVCPRPESVPSRSLSPAGVWAVRLMIQFYFWFQGRNSIQFFFLSILTSALITVLLNLDL